MVGEPEAMQGEAMRKREREPESPETLIDGSLQDTSEGAAAGEAAATYAVALLRCCMHVCVPTLGGMPG